MVATRKNITKRLRFEILRRDNNACRYCGATAPDVELVVDHVLPVALGGQTVAENLAAACKDCNSGKTSTSPDEHTVAQVNDNAIQWSQAIAQAAAQREARDTAAETFLEYIADEWAFRSPWHYPMPDDWRSSLLSYRNRGLPLTDFDRAIDIALTRRDIAKSARWRYFCGVLNNFTEELEVAAREIVKSSSASSSPVVAQ